MFNMQELWNNHIYLLSFCTQWGNKNKVKHEVYD